MKFRISVLFLFLTVTFGAKAQNSMRTFKGRVLDSATQAPIPDVSICIYRSSDTSLLNFGFTTPNGNFSLSTKSDDSLLVVVSHIKYNEFHHREPAMEGWNFKSFGDLNLARLAKQYKIVSVKTAAIRMNGDTIEINASKFKVLPGSDVAQLFKKIPGFEINVKGEIKVNGADVSKIMVDGSDFFGNNPGMVSKNLNADMIETVQVYEDRNEDGSPKENMTKVINLKLKKGKRNGLFGDILGGYGTNDRYEAGLRLNSFKNDRKMSLILNTNNINETGFDFGFNNWHGADNISRNGSESRSRYNLLSDIAETEGNLNRESNLGYTYFNEFSRRRKVSINTNLTQNKFSSISSSNRILGINDSTSRFNSDSSNSSGNSLVAEIEMDYTQKIDSTGDFEIGIAFNKQLNEVNHNISNSISLNNSLVNQGTTKSLADIDNQGYSLRMMYTRSLRKNRNYYFYLYGQYSVVDNEGTFHQFTQNSFDTFNNRNTLNFNETEYLLKGNLHAPVYKNKVMFMISADHWKRAGNSVQISQNAGNIGSPEFGQEYVNQVDSLSIHFRNNQEQFSLKPYFIYKKKGIYISTGATLLKTSLQTTNENNASSLNNSYSKFLPFLNVSFYPENKAYVYFSASKSSIFPNASDLMPVLNIRNNYERVEGNQGLVPQDNIGANLYMNLYRLKGFRYFYSSLRTEFSDNYKISASRQNEDGTVVLRPVNAKGYQFFQAWSGLSKRITKRLSTDLNISYTSRQTPNIVNEVQSLGIYNDLSIRPGLSISYSDSLELGFGMSWMNDQFTNSLNNNLNFKQNTYSYYFNIRTVLKYGTELNSDLRIADNRNIPGIGKLVPVWNAYLQQPLGKTGKYNIKLSAYDILKQNTNISRFASDNYIYLNTSNRLQRYFMLSLVYKIKKSGGSDENFEYSY